MKKSYILAFVLLLSCFVALFAGCSEKTYNGEYSYTQYGTNYGVKVAVTVDEDNEIEKVRILGSDYVEVSEPSGNWTQENYDNWKNNVSSLLKEYEGKKVSEILAMKVATKDKAPLSKDDDGFTAYDSDLLISGATLGSGRLLLAVQDALKDLK
ncbi:MAG: FMN-binding protein [Clostridia bacterium]|nr:FMN-binding protein [Clostridia bacterium]